jgi:hypothetical protein
VFEEFLMEKVNMPVTVNMHYFCDPDGHSCYVQSQEWMEKDYRTPSIGTITLRNAECRDVSTSLVCACGLPESPIGEITLENVTASFIPEAERKPAVPVMMDGFEPVSGESLWLKNVETLNVNGLSIQGEAVHDPVLNGAVHTKIENAEISGKAL